MALACCGSEKEGDRNYESFIIYKKALRKMPHGQAQGRIICHL
jgi:hypothetical protein